MVQGLLILVILAVDHFVQYFDAILKSLYFQRVIVDLGNTGFGDGNEGGDDFRGEYLGVEGLFLLVVLAKELGGLLDYLLVDETETVVTGFVRQEEVF